MVENKRTNDWTVETLREFVMFALEDRTERYRSSEERTDQLRAEQRRSLSIAIENVDRLLAASMQSNREAMVKLESTTETRFASVNEFRQALASQQNTFITRAETEAIIGRISERLQDLTDRINVHTGKGAGLNQGWIYLVAMVGFIESFAMIYAFTHGHML